MNKTQAKRIAREAGGLGAGPLYDPLLIKAREALYNERAPEVYKPKIIVHKGHSGPWVEVF